MENRRWLWALLPPQLRNLPADLATVVVLTLATVLAATLPVVAETPLRVVLGLPYVLFLPGYALVAALFPEAGPDRVEKPADDSGDTDDEETDGWVATGAWGESSADDDHSGTDGSTTGPSGVADAGIDGIERVALAFGTSIAVVPLVGLVLNFTPWGIRLVPILVAVSGVTLACTAVAARRRWALPADERFRVPYRQWYRAARDELFAPETRTDGALNVLLALSMLVAVASVGYAVAVPKEGESFSEFYLLTEGEDGELVADDYPTEFVRGEGQPLVVGIGNNEHEATTYTVVVQLQDVAVVDNETRVRERRELDRFGTRLAHNETWHQPYEVTPTMTGTRLRLQFLLYTDEAPANPRVENSYRDLHLWVNVTDGSAG
ncbi:Uncharacterized membrane protein [Halomicrobium zhouii]|uniref:Uncharacterized membrane protein n=1 Tax=Halomicrobium zhouii TaxID=767519 RepID=A0A1I6K724_9EURY|nr:DUF1616 domain-containing protein [Halomicrobium zhouii]SFR87029.1 Uncharacterized membrane protein [Halomicrobium zhouii]